ncbi:MAG: hypothetical protein HY549_00715 [Elusimicrobia bacterium]|nr:hypothetical protein [Elusimicrobiota bacterium]
MVRDLSTDFFRCERCGRLYWNGAHTDRTIKKLKRLGVDENPGMSLPFGGPFPGLGPFQARRRGWLAWNGRFSRPIAFFTGLHSRGGGGSHGRRFEIRDRPSARLPGKPHAARTPSSPSGGFVRTSSSTPMRRRATRSI